jgi:hypothetical protein
MTVRGLCLEADVALARREFVDDELIWVSGHFLMQRVEGGM